MHSFRSHFVECHFSCVLRAPFITCKTEVRWVRKKEIGRWREDRNFCRSRFRPFRGGFMSLAVANDFAFPNEDIRRSSIRKTTFNLAKTGDHRGVIRAKRCSLCAEKKYWRSFSFLDADPNFTSGFPHRWRSKRSTTSTDPLFLPLLSSPSLTVVVAFLIRVLIWLSIKPNIRQTVISEFRDDAIILTLFIARCHKTWTSSRSGIHNAGALRPGTMRTSCGI